MILSEGSVVYYGPSSDVDLYLTSIEYYLPPNSSSSAVDYVLELLYSENTTIIDGFRHKDILKAKWDLKNTNDDDYDQQITTILYQGYSSTYITRFIALYKRESILSRTKQFSILEFIETIVVAALSGLCWYQLQPYESEITNISSYISFANSYWLFKSIFSGGLEFLPSRL